MKEHLEDASASPIAPAPSDIIYLKSYYRIVKDNVLDIRRHTLTCVGESKPLFIIYNSLNTNVIMVNE